MPLRGSVQLLLLSLRQRETRRAGIGAAALVLLLTGAVQLQGALPSIGQDGLAQALRQSVWKQALGDQAQATAWPWQDLSANMSLAPGAVVPRLGLSAAMRDQIIAEPASPAPDSVAHAKTTASHTQPRSPQTQGDVALSDVATGGSITFTAADGATCVYQVTGRRVVDPHLAASEAVGGEASLFECSPLESLIMQATQGAAQGEQQVPAALGDDQQKL